MMNKKTLYIRTEANVITATGHMTRCIAIADGARKCGMEAVFIVAENGSKEMPMAKGFEVIVLDRKWDDFDGEIEIISRLIKDLDIRCLLIDSYFVSEKYMSAVNKLTLTAYIDDLHERVWPVGVIINYSIYSDLFDYDSEYSNAHKLLGMSYVPMKPEYSVFEVKPKGDVVSSALVVTGGSDENHFMLGLTKLILSRPLWKNVVFTFILGKFNRDYDAICELAKKADNIVVSGPIPTLLDSMNSSDMIITAGGTTLYEMARCNTPGVVVRIADNQHYNADGFVRNGLVLDGGDVEEKDYSFDKLADSIDEIINNKETRARLINNMQGVVDGNGARRIAEKLGSFI